MEFSGPEYWSGQLFHSAADLPNPGIEARSTALQADSLPAEPPGSLLAFKQKLKCLNTLNEMPMPVVEKRTYMVQT